MYTDLNISILMLQCSVLYVWPSSHPPNRALHTFVWEVHVNNLKDRGKKIPAASLTVLIFNWRQESGLHCNPVQHSSMENTTGIIKYSHISLAWQDYPY